MPKLVKLSIETDTEAGYKWSVSHIVGSKRRWRSGNTDSLADALTAALAQARDLTGEK